MYTRKQKTSNSGTNNSEKEHEGTYHASKESIKTQFDLWKSKAKAECTSTLSCNQPCCIAGQLGSCQRAFDSLGI